MQPPILRWKVMLALLAVVGIGVTLGSVFRPTSKPLARRWAEYGPLAGSIHCTAFGKHPLCTGTGEAYKLYKESQHAKRSGSWQVTYVSLSQRQMLRQLCADPSAPAPIRLGPTCRKTSKAR